VKRTIGSVSAPRAPVAIKWYYRPVWVLILLFFVLGPFALPYLWRSPRFTRGLKIALTISVVAYTGLLVGETIRIVHAVQDELKELQLSFDS
jgi:hypothetical protein